MTAEPLPTKADDLICFALYSASHAVTRAYAPMLRDLGLTYPQYIALTFLWVEDGLSVGGLSERMKMETNTLTPLMKRLEALGHVTRARGKQDERQVFVHLTERGRAMQVHAPEITRCIVEGTGFDLAELEALVHSVTRLRDAMTR
ncbi:MAG: MarR family transcriptional regulator [Ascidiaceihabitans sp.]|nr:MarR family transcriptional regulator [Ascidiaceihabitans sp.]